MGDKKAVSKDVAFWLQEIADARKREKKYRRDARDAVKVYETEECEKHPFNILYSNTETLKAALFNSTPRPVVQRRFKSDDILGAAAAQVATRYLEYYIDSNDKDYTTFDDLMGSAITESLVPGRGITAFKYDAELEKVEEPEEIASEGDEGEVTLPAAPSERVTYETVCGESVDWDRVFFGYARTWSKVPWIAFELFMTQEQLSENFGEAAIGIPLSIKGDDGRSDEDEEKVQRPNDMAGADLAHIYKIWDKESRQVIFICPEVPNRVIKQVEDPLKLDGFFPVPRPVMLGTKISSMLPIPLYKWYKEQDKELNRITVRINKIVNALKVRGFYDSTIQGIEKVLTAADNDLLPAENTAALYDKGGLEKSIFLVPIEKLVSVLQQLYVQREQVKATIYEITALADIMRGQTQASETLGAQQIKSQWGSLRLRRLQKEVQRYVRDCLRIVAEIAFKQLSAETLQKITGLAYPTAEEKRQAQMLLQQSQMTGQPPNPAVQQVLSMPTWDEIISVLKDDLLRNYKIDIETNSTIEMEQAEDKQAIGEFLNALAQFLNGIMPLVQTGQMPFEVMKEMLLAVVRRYRFGVDIEDQIRRMQAPPPPPKPGEDPAAAAKAKVAEAQTNVDLKKIEIEGRVMEAEAAAKMQKLEREQALAEAQFAFKMQKLRLNSMMPQPAQEVPENASV